MLKAAVIGVGSMGRNHVRVYREVNGVELVGVSDHDKDTAARVGSVFNVPFYTDYQKMLDECKPDLVTLAVPTDKHYKVGMDLIDRGVNLLIEKPIAPTLEEAHELVEMAQRNGVTLGA